MDGDTPGIGGRNKLSIASNGTRRLKSTAACHLGRGMFEIRYRK